MGAGSTPAVTSRPLAHPHTASDYKDRGSIVLTEPIRPQKAQPLSQTFTRPPNPADPTRDLNPTQQALEARLREWRKSESERIGLPQFFVLGTTTLRSIVLERPTTLDKLKAIQGIDPEKLQRFGPAILAVCSL